MSRPKGYEWADMGAQADRGAALGAQAGGAWVGRQAENGCATSSYINTQERGWACRAGVGRRGMGGQAAKCLSWESLFCSAHNLRLNWAVPDRRQAKPWPLYTLIEINRRTWAAIGVRRLWVHRLSDA